MLTEVLRVPKWYHNNNLRFATITLRWFREIMLVLGRIGGDPVGQAFIVLSLREVYSSILLRLECQVIAAAVAALCWSFNFWWVFHFWFAARTAFLDVAIHCNYLFQYTCFLFMLTAFQWVTCNCSLLRYLVSTPVPADLSARPWTSSGRASVCWGIRRGKTLGNKDNQLILVQIYHLSYYLLFIILLTWSTCQFLCTPLFII